jgi:hypothetical protein
MVNNQDSEGSSRPAFGLRGLENNVNLVTLVAPLTETGTS